MAFSQQRGTTDDEIEVPSAGNPELSKVPTFETSADQNIATHVSPTARNSASLMSAFLVRSTSFVTDPLSWLTGR